MLKRDTLWRECIAEFIGLFIIIFFGAGSVAALVFIKNYDSFWELSVMWGIAVAIAIYVSGGVSGGHLNPGVTIANAIFYEFPWKKVAPYIIAQVAGAFCAAIVVYLLYINNFAIWLDANDVVKGSPESIAIAKIFCTYSADYLSNFHACLVELCITALFMIVILAVSDQDNTAAPSAGIGALTIGAAVALIGGTFGALTGFALNPARDLGPRIFISLAGWGQTGIPAPDFYFWVPIVGPTLGCIVGAFVYKTFIHTSLAKIKAGTTTL